ncbi:MAG TPA: hypothetical protein VG166_00780, partial [Caulobacteraceae bacterium]|nr:hypothetical protein [Caulobacteraceae bacterium]
QGPKGFESWAADLMKDAKAHGDTNAGVTLGNVARQEVTGSRAYVVFPAVYSFTEKGVALREAGHMTFVLARGKAGWKIAAWTWTGPTRATRAGK